MPRLPRRARIFLSHSWADNPWCEEYVKLLEEAGADVWWDVARLAHGLIPPAVSDEIEQRPIFITVLTPESVKRPWIVNEYSAALMLTHQRPDEQRIIWPIVVRKCKVPAILAPYVRVQGKGQVDLTPREAAEATIRALGITPVSRRRKPRVGNIKNPDKLVTRGRASLIQGRPDEALIYFDSALPLAEKSGDAQQIANALYGRGRALEDLGRIEEAVKAYDDAITRVPNDPQSWAGRGTLRAQAHENAEALEDLDQAVALKPDYIAVWLNRSNVLRHLGRLQEALASAEQALAHDPNNGPALGVKASALDELGRLDEALACSDSALVAHGMPETSMTVPRSWQAVVLHNRGNILLKLSCPLAAYESYSRSIEAEPSYPLPYLGQGDALARLKRYDEALACYELALIVLPEDDIGMEVSTRIGLAATLTNLGRPEEGVFEFRRALKLNPVSAEALHGLGNALRDMGRGGEALDAYVAAIRTGQFRGARLASVWNEIGAIFAKRADMGDQTAYGEALHAFDAGIAADNLDARCWHNKSILLLQMGQPEQAQSVQSQFAHLLLIRAFEQMASDPTQG